MASHQPVPPRLALDSASNQGGGDDDDSADDGCFDNDDDDDDDDPGHSSTSYQCSLAGDLDDDDAWIAPADMAILKALPSSDAATLKAGDSPALHHRPHHRIRRLPKGTRPLRFIGEGAANAVFEIKDDCAAADFTGLLLRVAKVQRGQAPSFNYPAQQRFYQASIKPLLGGHAVHQELVILHKSGIVDKLNQLLQDIDSTRKSKFRGTFVGQSDWGFLVEDMRPRGE
ncbi:hypothetical protein CDD83_1460 [Cordyceps sp. RAO-2017]|nr:hypothetical protein CDD83_1460 [Cordyceps sp. RAO-2017]